MPIKNRRTPSNDSFLGEITGINEREKKILEDAGIGGGGKKLNTYTGVAVYQDGYMAFDSVSLDKTIPSTEEEFNLKITDNNIVATYEVTMKKYGVMDTGVVIYVGNSIISFVPEMSVVINLVYYSNEESVYAIYPYPYFVEA